MRPHSIHATSTARGTVLPAVLAALAAVVTSSGCDNSTCVFGGNCFDGGAGAGGIGSFPATFPEDGLWIQNGAPRIDNTFPSGTDVAATTVLAVRFDESVAASTLAGSFELFEIGGGFGGDTMVPLDPPASTGDGRLAIVRPTSPLTAGGMYELRGTAMPSVTDLEGNLVTGLADAVLTSFTVEANPSTEPNVVTTYPPGGATSQSRTTEIVAVFDRPIDPLTLNLASFQVRVDGQTPPANPLPQTLDAPSASGGTAPELRVVTWRSVDATGGALDLAASSMTQPAPVDLTLAGIAPQGGGSPLASTVVSFSLLPFRAPLGAVLNTLSMDGIGVSDLIGAPPSFSIDVQFEDAQPGDVVELFMFGAAPGGGSNDIAILRSKTIAAATMMDRWDADEIDLAPPTAPVSAALGDGFVAFAFRVVRNNAGTPVRLLDVDPAVNGIQDPLLDTVEPTLVGFGVGGGDAMVFRSDVRDLVLTGVASEELRFADVDAGALGSHGLMTPVVGSSSSGLFVAAPIAIGGATPGLLDEPTAIAGAPFDVTLYDRVGNASMPMAGTFFQVGAHGPGAALPGAGQITVGAFASDTLQPVAGATVFVHDTAGAFVASGTTDATGFAQVAAAGATPSVVTVDAAGFDLFTYDGATSARLTALIDPTGLPPGSTTGTISSPNPDLGLLTGFVGDSRRGVGEELLIQASACSPNVFTGETECPFNPIVARLGRAGASGFVGVALPADEASYGAATFLRAFALEVPRAGLTPGMPEVGVIEVERLLDEPGVPMSELPVDLSAADYDDTLLDPTDGTMTNRSDGSPRFTVEAVVHGLVGRVPAGAAVGFDPDVDGVHRVRSAVSGSVVAGGSLFGAVVDSGVPNADAGLALTMESRDASGNRAGRRRTYPIPAMPVQTPPALPTITAPTAMAPPAGAAYQVSVSDVLPDGLSENGVYRVVLTGSNGRRWTIVQRDEPGAADVDLRVPDIGANGGTPLPPGGVTATSSAFAWPSFTPAAWMFSDAARLHDHFAERFDHAFTQP